MRSKVLTSHRIGHRHVTVASASRTRRKLTGEHLDFANAFPARSPNKNVRAAPRHFEKMARAIDDYVLLSRSGRSGSGQPICR